MENFSKDQNYRFTIIEAINYLNEVKNNLYLKMVNVAMAGEMNDVDSIFEEGDMIKVRIADLKNLNDDNIHALHRQYKVTEEIIDYLIERNEIEDSELGITVT